jgi:hypothetical protein
VTPSRQFLLLAALLDSRLFLAIPYRAFELSQHAIEYMTHIPAGIFVRGLSRGVSPNAFCGIHP